MKRIYIIILGLLLIFLLLSSMIFGFFPPKDSSFSSLSSSQENTEISQNAPSPAIETQDTNFVILPYLPEKHFYIFPDGKNIFLAEAERKQGYKILLETLGIHNIAQKERFENAVLRNPNFERSEEEFVIYPEKYLYQYMAFENNTGQKVLWMNAFRGTQHLNWREVVVDAHDGGNSYFQILIDLETSEVLRFSVNGEA